jgi:hypothetical protein
MLVTSQIMSSSGKYILIYYLFKYRLSVSIRALFYSIDINVSAVSPNNTQFTVSYIPTFSMEML